MGNFSHVEKPCVLGAVIFHLLECTMTDLNHESFAPRPFHYTWGIYCLVTTYIHPFIGEFCINKLLLHKCLKTVENKNVFSLLLLNFTS